MSKNISHESQFSAQTANARDLSPIKSLSVIGCGYVGLVTALSFAERGYRVFCVENDPTKLDLLQKGQPHFYEPGLKDLLQKHWRRKTVRFSARIADALEHSCVQFLCLPTPEREDGSADLSILEAVARDIASQLPLREYHLIVHKSTVPVKTGLRLQALFQDITPQGTQVDVASNPEFLREGQALYDATFPDRIVIGTESPQALHLMRQLYAPWREVQMIETDINSAELIKHAANSFLALKISYINAIAHVCELSGADVTQVAQGIGLDARIGTAFLNAGVGYGGSCFPKDVKAFAAIAQDLGYNFNLLHEVHKVNEQQIETVLHKVYRALENSSGASVDTSVALWGLAFKPNTDDIRNAPALKVMDRLLAQNITLRLYDPQAMAAVRQRYASNPQVHFANDPYEAVQAAQALVILTEWDEFKRVDWHKIHSLMSSPWIVDGRNMLNLKEIQALGFNYLSIGRPAALQEAEMLLMR